MRLRPQILLLGCLLFALFLLSARLAALASSAATQPGCKVPSTARIVERDGRAVLFVVRYEEDEARELWGCVRGRTRRRLLAEEIRAGSLTEDFSQVRLARGRFAFARGISSAHEPGYRSWVVTGSLIGKMRRATTFVGGCAVAELRLGDRGGVAWRHGLAVAVADVDGRRIVDAGPVEPRSLALNRSGRFVSWRRDGETQSLSLGARAGGDGALSGCN